MDNGSLVILVPHGARGWFHDTLQTKRFKIFQKFETVNQLRVISEVEADRRVEFSEIMVDFESNLDPGSIPYSWPQTLKSLLL